jgi:DNA repair exonuclease SbcCD ATPase subunit
VRTWGSREQAVSRVDFYRNDEPHWVKRSTVKNGLWLDGKLVSQEEIDRLIGLTLANIPHTILLGQKRDLFFDLKPQSKLELLSETLELDRWETRSARAKDKVRELEGVQGGIAGRRLATNDQLDELLHLIEKVKRKSGEWEDERSSITDKREQQIDKLKKAREAAVTAKGTHDLAYDGAETELRAARKDLTKKSAERDALVDARAKEEVVHAKLANKYDELRALANSDTCPTCGQSIKEHARHASDAKSLMKEVKRRRDLSHDRIVVRETQLELFDKVIARVRKSIDDFAAKSDAAKDKLDHGDKHVAELDKQIAVLVAQNEEQVNPYAEQLAASRAAVKRMRREIVEHTEEWDKLERRIVRTKYWVNGFMQVRLYLLQETLEELEEVTQNLLPEFGLPGWSVKYDIERETKAGGVSTGLSVKILKPGMSKAVRWEAWSGGEGQRLLIVGAIALSEVLLRRAGIECDLLVLDEPTRHMSKEGVEETVEYLISRGRDAQIFYVDHQVIESNRFASVITIEKDKAGAKIKVAA